MGLIDKVGSALNQAFSTLVADNKFDLIGLSIHGDSVYLLDAEKVLKSSLLSLEKTLLFETAKDVFFNVLAEKLSVGNITGGIFGGVSGGSLNWSSIFSYLETFLTLILNSGYFGDRNWYYKFKFNPSKLTITRRKKQTITHYGWGLYDLEYFGDEIVFMQFSGKTGNLMPPYPLPSIGIWDPRLSVSYIKFAHLEKFYRNSENRLFLTVYGKVFYGFLSDLSYTVDANNPRVIDYSFNFNAHPQFIFDIFTGNFSEVSKVNTIVWEDNSKASFLQTASEYVSGLTDYTLRILG